MRPSGEPSEAEGIRPLPDFELPEGDDFQGIPRRLSMEELYRRCQELREWFPQSIPTAEERWARKVHVEFEF